MTTTPRNEDRNAHCAGMRRAFEFLDLALSGQGMAIALMVHSLAVLVLDRTSSGDHGAAEYFVERVVDLLPIAPDWRRLFPLDDCPERVARSDTFPGSSAIRISERIEGLHLVAESVSSGVMLGLMLSSASEVGRPLAPEAWSVALASGMREVADVREWFAEFHDDEIPQRVWDQIAAQATAHEALALDDGATTAEDAEMGVVR
jgi:hypothetical protein